MGNGGSESSSFSDRPPDPQARAGDELDNGPPITLAGFYDGAGRLYLNRTLNQYVEFRPSDVRNFGDLVPERAPFFGEQGTWIELEPTAEIEYCRSGSAGAANDLAVEVRVRASAGRFIVHAGTGTRKLCLAIDSLLEELPFQ